MTNVHYNMPPELAEHAAARSLGPCLVCLMFAKGDQVEGSRETWQPLVNDGDATAQKWIEYPGNPIREAVMHGINDFFPNGPLMPLCWDHSAAIAPPAPADPCKWCNGTGRKTNAKIQPASGALPPGFLNGSRDKRGSN